MWKAITLNSEELEEGVATYKENNVVLAEARRLLPYAGS